MTSCDEIKTAAEPAKSAKETCQAADPAARPAEPKRRRWFWRRRETEARSYLVSRDNLRTIFMLLFCGTLAMGEFLASLDPLACGIWPFLAIVAVLVALFGYGFGVPAWWALFAFLAGGALYFGFAEGQIEENRHRLWDREKIVATWCEDVTEGAAYEVKCDFSSRIAIGLDDRDEAVALGRAILLGERDDLPWRTKKLFMESGTMHVFAISGLHVMAIAEVLTLILSGVLLPRRFVGVFAVPLLWGYVAVINFPPSAVRAATMVTFSLLAPIVWCKPCGLWSWCLTFLIVHVLNPLLVSNVGNALSFVVMLAIVLADDMGRGLAKWKKDLLISFAAWAVGVPISAHIFGRVTPGSMLANFVLIGTAKFSVYAGTAGLLFSYVSESVAAHVNNLCALGVRSMVLMAEAVTHVPGTNFETGVWGYDTCIEWYVALALGSYLFVCRLHRRKML